MRLQIRTGTGIRYFVLVYDIPVPEKRKSNYRLTFKNSPTPKSIDTGFTEDISFLLQSLIWFGFRSLIHWTQSVFNNDLLLAADVSNWAFVKLLCQPLT